MSDIELKEIVTRYDNAKCAKCGRDIKRGWTVFFSPVEKVVYCKPCGQAMQNPVDSSEAPTERELMLDELAGNIKLFNALIASQGDAIKIVIESITDIETDMKEVLKAVKAFAKK